MGSERPRSARGLSPLLPSSSSGICPSSKAHALLDSFMAPTGDTRRPGTATRSGDLNLTLGRILGKRCCRTPELFPPSPTNLVADTQVVFVWPPACLLR